MNRNSGYWLDCDYISGACYCYENALRHFDTSKSLATIKNYGFGVSHLILGAEELIKSLILVRLNTERYFIEDAQKEELFKNHSFKHINIREFFRSLTEAEMNDYYDNWYDLAGIWLVLLRLKISSAKQDFFLAETFNWVQ
jgi:hypothetical protein